MTPERVRELFSYDPLSGELKWRISQGSIKSGKILKTLNNTGYIGVSADKKYYLAHRLIWLYVHGKFPDGQIDHINGHRNDNRLENLRDVAHRENSRNQRLSAKNSSGIVGVGWHKAQSKWQAFIGVSRKTVYLGKYEGFFEACCARKSAENKFGFHPNHGKNRLRYPIWNPR